MTEIESQKLMNGFYAGAKEVINKKEELNRINVFPVADGDTGSNLASLMQAIVDNVTPKNYSVKELLDEIASAALIGARGNSGIIFAQYFSSIAECYPKEEASIAGLFQAFKKAVSKAYSALSDPKEGTILSVMTIWSDSLVKSFGAGNSLDKALTEAQKSAEKAVVETQNQLTVLKKNKVVDSGAKGFYYFISGFTNTILGKDLLINIENEEIKTHSIQETHLVTEEPTYRYCSEFIIKNKEISNKQLREELVSKGDSVIIAGTEELTKIHIHTNEPQIILKMLEEIGVVSHQKVDDMLLQYKVSTKQKHAIGIVTDSIADLPEAFLLEHQIHVLPINILAEDRSYLDKLTINSKLVEEKLNHQIKLSTAQPSIQAVDSLLSFLENKYEQVIVITVSAELSGTNQLLQQRIREKQFSSEWIQVIDSKANSVAQGLLVKQAALMVERSMSFFDVVSEIRKLVKQTFIYVAVADLNPMIQSGRIPKKIGELAKKLSIYPIVSLDEVGNGKLMGVSFSQKGSMKKITNKINKLSKKNQLSELAITHVRNKEKAQEWEKTLNKRDEKVSFIVGSSAAIAISAGIGSLAIAGIKKEVEI